MRFFGCSFLFGRCRLGMRRHSRHCSFGCLVRRRYFQRYFGRQRFRYRFGSYLFDQLGRFPVVVFASLARRERYFGRNFLRLYLDRLFYFGSLLCFFGTCSFGRGGCSGTGAAAFLRRLFCPTFWRLQPPFSFPPLALWPLRPLFWERIFFRMVSAKLASIVAVGEKT